MPVVWGGGCLSTRGTAQSFLRFLQLHVASPRPLGKSGRRRSRLRTRTTLDQVVPVASCAVAIWIKTAYFQRRRFIFSYCFHSDSPAWPEPTPRCPGSDSWNTLALRAGHQGSEGPVPLGCIQPRHCQCPRRRHDQAFFSLTTMLGMINPQLPGHGISLQAQSRVGIHAPFRLLPRWTRLLPVSFVNK